MPAIYRDFAKVGQEFSQNNDFAFVYIEEAHATDEWPISSSRYTPDNQIVSVEQPKLASERVKLAQRFVRTFGLGTEMKVLVDDPENGNQFEAAYGKNDHCFLPTQCFYSIFVLTDPPSILSSMANQAICH